MDTPIVAGAPARKTYFDLLRLGAAAAVLFSHSYAVVGRGEPGLGSQSIGNIAVLVFFAISGFLIAGSWRSEPRLPLFLAKRTLRIMPALLAVLLLSAFALGPLASSVGLGTYLSDLSVYRYVGASAVVHTTYRLPGVFADNPMPGVVNGSLWTLRHEVLCYLMIAGLGFAGLLRNRWVATLVLIEAIFSFALAGGHGPAFFDQSTLERTCLRAPDAGLARQDRVVAGARRRGVGGVGCAGVSRRRLVAGDARNSLRDDRGRGFDPPGRRAVARRQRRSAGSTSGPSRCSRCSSRRGMGSRRWC